MPSCDRAQWRLFYWRKGGGKEEDQPLETGTAEEGEERPRDREQAERQRGEKGRLF